MMELSPGLDTGIVATALVAMLAMAVWLLFRVESNGEESLFVKTMSPTDDEFGPPVSAPPCFPPSTEGPSLVPLTAHDHGVAALNQSMKLIPFAQQKKAPRKSPEASSMELKNGKNTELD